jgi:hypothetical protein
MTYFNSTIYGVFRNSAGTTSQLHQFDTTAATWGNPLDLDTSVEGERIMGIFSVNNILFIEKLETESGTDYYDPYTLWYTTDGTTYAKAGLDNTTLQDGISLRLIFDGAYDGTNYWLVSGNTIYTGTTGTSFQETSITDTNGNAITLSDIGGIYYNSDLNMLFLSSKDGLIYIYDIGSSLGWYPSTAFVDTEVVFYDFAYIPAPSGYAYGEFIVIVGSDEGYYEIPRLDDLTSITLQKPGADLLTTSLNYLNTSLSQGSVRNFYIDEDPSAGGSVTYGDDILFACTTNNGLWINKLNDDATFRIWSRE